MNRITRFALLAIATSLSTLSAQDGMKELKLDFPPPAVTGTPVPVKVSNLEPASAARKSVMIPSDATNLAKDKDVTSSDTAPLIGDLSLVTDGDKEADEGYYVELSSGKQWIQIDLGQPGIINAIGLWHYHSQIRVYNDVIIQVSDDPDFITGVTTIFNADDDNSSGLGKGSELSFTDTNEGKVIDGKGAKGRYIRLYSNGNTANGQNHYIEVEVWGKPAA